MVTPFPESYLEDQATRSVSGGCREQRPCDLRSPSRSPASKGLAFQAGSRVTWVRIKKLDFCVKVCRADFCNHVCAGIWPNSIEGPGKTPQWCHGSTKWPKETCQCCRSPDRGSGDDRGAASGVWSLLIPFPLSSESARPRSRKQVDQKQQLYLSGSSWWTWFGYSCNQTGLLTLIWSLGWALGGSWSL